ncbi:MAG: asparagine--tRNA ligase [Nitrososphaerota archaeon]|nr:asparagine--tRNA ligase [Nitrososphaerota archaeon]MDG6921823.1 asparagine--tRNA ligase [Nitrososphaerota archaeon]
MQPKVRSHTIREALDQPEGTSVTIMGWIANKSSIGGIKFATVRDGSGFIQVACKKDRVSEKAFADFESASRESAVAVTGSIREDRRATGGKEISVTDFWVLAPAEKWPITKSAVKSASYLYDKRHLAIRGKRASAILRIRAEVIYAAFDYFVENGFTLISAPTIVQNAVEGGATLFEINYFNKKAYLSQSAQLYEEAAITAFGKVFIFQPAFRAEKSKTNKHLTEFWMIEAEQAFAGQEENLRLQEGLVRAMATRVIERRADDLAILGRRLKFPEIPFPRVTYDEAREISVKNGVVFEWGEDLPTEAERIVSKQFDVPFFITGYPLTARSFYHMTEETNEKVTRSADMIAPEGYGEIATGGQRIHDYKQLMDRIATQDLPTESFEWYLELRRYGMPEHSGFGIGAERVTRWMCGLKHIRATSLFPRTINRVKP